MNILITGGLGFIGINTAIAFSRGQNNIIIFDNLSKPGSIHNYNIAKRTGANIFIGDLRNYSDILRISESYRLDAVFHFAAQTAVTTSVSDPVKDFKSNAIGTFHLLEAIRLKNIDAKIIYSSTNKVYGDLKTKNIAERDKLYSFIDIAGIDEDEPLNFCSPYGCSKGAADQYVRDYARSYDMQTAVIRQSCIYGEYQDGTEDQGWVAWFTKAFLENRPITIYGNGKQVRDILYISDLVNFFQILINSEMPGEIYNIGGGFANSVSLLEFIDLLTQKIGSCPPIDFDKERIGDQKIFISDNGKARKLGWRPFTSIQSGIENLIEYLK